MTAAGILGEIGDPKRFESWEQVRKYAGFNLVEDSSGAARQDCYIKKRSVNATEYSLPGSPGDGG